MSDSAEPWATVPKQQCKIERSNCANEATGANCWKDATVLISDSAKVLYVTVLKSNQCKMWKESKHAGKAMVLFGWKQGQNGGATMQKCASTHERCASNQAAVAWSRATVVPSKDMVVQSKDTVVWVKGCDCLVKGHNCSGQRTQLFWSKDMVVCQRMQLCVLKDTIVRSKNAVVTRSRPWIFGGSHWVAADVRSKPVEMQSKP